MSNAGHQLPDDTDIATATVCDLMDMIESRYSGQITPRDLDVAKVAFAAGAGQPCACWCHATDSAVPSQDAPDSGGELPTHGGNPTDGSGPHSHADTA